MKGLRKKYKTHRYGQQYGDHQKKRGSGDLREGKEGINGDGRRLDLGW